MRFKIVKLMAIGNGPKWTMSTSGELELLQMTLEPDNKHCASKDDELPRGWIVRSHIDWRGKRNIPHKGVEISP